MKKKETVKFHDPETNMDVYMGKIESDRMPMPILQNMGRPKIFEKIEDLLTGVFNYFTWCDDHPIYTSEFRTVDKDLVEVSIPHRRPYSIKGMQTYLGVGPNYFAQIIDFQSSPPSNIPYADFSEIWNSIKDIIYQQKFDGAAVGIFNTNLIIRDLGLADKKQIELPNVNDELTFE